MVMQFYRKRSTATAVPIVPMIDILTILLIFFIINTQWKRPQYFLKIDIASAEFLDTVKSDAAFDVLAVSADSQITFNGKLVKLESLPALLKEYSKKNPDKRLQLDIDKKVSVELLVGVFDALSAAGIDVKELPFRINQK